MQLVTFCFRLLPKARVLYCSATGVTDVKNMVRKSQSMHQQMMMISFQFNVDMQSSLLHYLFINLFLWHYIDIVNLVESQLSEIYIFSFLEKRIIYMKF